MTIVDRLRAREVSFAAMRDEIEIRFKANLDRVRAIVVAYQGRARPGSGQQAVHATDLLRAAVVFLHATMEDVLRSALEWKWPETTSRELLSDVPVLGHNRDGKIELADLLPHRGTSVNDLIRRSVQTHLERTSFNHVGDVKKAIERMGLDPAVVTPYQGDLASLIARRHNIVHRADRLDGQGSGYHGAASLGQGLVSRWTASVEGLCTDILAAI
jgi:hypothetical protein